jgi:hypothetical protein
VTSIPAPLSGKMKGSGLLTYAMVMLGLAGVFNVVDGIVALSKSSFYVGGAAYVFGDLHTWGWIVLILGVVEIAAAMTIARGSEVARWFGVVAASVNAFAQLMFLHANPWWSLSAFAMDILIVYALIVYGGAKINARFR